MINKLEALSQPVAWTDAEELAEMQAGTYASMFNGDYIPKDDKLWFGLYSQEYVTALLEEVRITKGDRDKNGWYVHECSRLQKLLELNGIKYE